MTARWAPATVALPSAEMARLARKHLPDGDWHVTTRGTGGIHITQDELDRSTLARLMGIAEDRFGLRIIAWCVMGTH